MDVLANASARQAQKSETREILPTKSLRGRRLVARTEPQFHGNAAPRPRGPQARAPRWRRRAHRGRRASQSSSSGSPLPPRMCLEKPNTKPRRRTAAYCDGGAASREPRDAEIAALGARPASREDAAPCLPWPRPLPRRRRRRPARAANLRAPMLHRIAREHLATFLATVLGDGVVKPVGSRIEWCQLLRRN